MKALEITTIIGCKVQCDYCPQDKITRAYVDRGGTKILSPKDYEVALGKLPREVLIHFSGMAEPWLNPACTEMVLLTHRRGHEISVFTTAVGMTPPDVHRFSAIPFRDFVLHLPDTEGHAKIPVDDLYLETIDAIVRGDIRGLSYMTMGTLPGRVKKIVGRRVRPTRMMSRAGNVPGKTGIQTPPRLVGEIRCKSCGDLFDHNVLLPNGDVILCCMDYGMRHVLGNLFTSEYESLFSGEEFRGLVKGLDDESMDILCRYCENASCREEWNRPVRKSFFRKIFGLR